MALTKVVTDIIGSDTLSGISGSFRGELSSSVYLRQVSSTISGSLGANASVIRTLDRTTISGSIPQALATNSSPTFAAGTITGDLSVGGTLTAQEVHTEFESASILFTSGSTRFGDDTTDTHRVTGSMDVSGSLDIPHGNLSVIDRVGVGTNNPTVALEVFGSSDQQIRIDSTGNRAQLQFDGKKTSDAEFAEINFANDGDSAAAIHAMRDGANDAARLAFMTQATGGSVTERMSIDSGGNVGIGTNNPTKLLDLESSGTEASMDFTNDAQTYRIGINDFGTGDDRIFISDVTKDITRMSITTAGSTLLSGSLQIESDLDTPLTIKKTSNGEMFIRFMNASGAMKGALIYRTDSNQFSLRTDNTTAFSIDSSQLVSFNGDIELNGSSTRQIRFDDGSTSEGAIVFDELTNGFIFKVGGTSGTGKTDALKILNDGNVGIKVTPEDWDAANAFSVLQVGLGGCVGGYGTSTPHAFLGNNIYFDDTNNRWQYIVNDTAQFYHQNNDGKHIWFTADSGTADAEVTLNQRMVILNDGKVGIGTDSPTAQLLISGSGSSQGTLVVDSGNNDPKHFELRSTGDVAHGITDLENTSTFFRINKVVGNDGGAQIAAYTENTIAMEFAPRCTNEISAASPSTSDQAPFNIILAKKGGSSVQALDSSKMMVAIRNSSNTRFIFDSDGRGYANNTFTTFSDSRLKKNIIEIPYGLDTVNKLKPKKYVRYSGDIKDGEVVLEEDGWDEVGFLAQDIKEIIPELISNPNNDETKGFYAMDDGKMTSILVKAIQELSTKVTKLEAQISGSN
tara:strand:- start:4381 stop:6768 length:2388 start_codon:yes stop_codon:yes gene_type:complete